MPNNTKAQQWGFTIIELMITVAIIGILALLVYPSYISFVLESNRTEGQRELLRLANLQEQLYTDSRAYTTDMKKLGLGASPFITENGLYSISATVSGDTFTLKASAKLAQLKDTNCLTMTITDTGAKTPKENCWE